MKVQRIVVGPAVVGLPGVVAALEKNVRRPVVPHDEDHVALPARHRGAVRQQSQTTEVNAADPVSGNLQGRRRLPLAFAQPPGPDLRIRLHPPRKRTERLHQPRTAAAVVAHPDNLDLEAPGRIGADHDVERLAGLDALARAIALDKRRAEPARLVQPHACQLPVLRARLGILGPDDIRSRRCRAERAGERTH